MTEETGTSALPWATHADMVQKLFKHMPGSEGDLLHAAIGISGEVGELIAAESRENIIEECGDMEFYLEAAWQSIGTEPAERVVDEADPFGVICTSAAMCAANILDCAKKAWVYEKPLDDVMVLENLIDMGEVLCSIYGFLGTTVEDIKRFNMVKLAKRYHSGQYSNAQAQARADKSEGA